MKTDTMKWMVKTCFGVMLCLTCMTSQAWSQNYPWLKSADYHPEQSLENRVPAPPGFERIPVEEGSFAQWLRQLPLLPEGSRVRLYPVESGNLKGRANVHQVVVDLDVLKFQECADAVIRLRAEYLWAAGKADSICFNFTSGDACCWEKWREGQRPVINGGNVTWRQSANPDSSRKTFRQYLGKVMEFAGTASMARDLQTIAPEQLAIGDVLIQGGHPGHAVLVLDMAENNSGQKIMLLGQSYMPAQEFHVLKNPADSASPWYAIQSAGELVTPEWKFNWVTDCRRFAAENRKTAARETEPDKVTGIKNFEEAEEHYSRAKKHLEKGEVKQAIMEFQWAVNIDPVHPRLREFSFAMFPVMDSAREKCPGEAGSSKTDRELCAFLEAYEYMTAGPIQEAIRSFEGCVEQNPDEPLYRLYLGELYGKANNYKGAFNELRIMNKILSSHNKSFYRGELELGDAVYRTRGPDAARSWWHSAAQKSRVPWVRQEAEKRLSAVGQK